MAADVGQGSWRPGTGRASGDVRSGEQVLKITKHLPNSKPCPTALFVFSPKAVLERSVIPPPPPATMRDTGEWWWRQKLGPQETVRPQRTVSHFSSSERFLIFGELALSIFEAMPVAGSGHLLHGSGGPSGQRAADGVCTDVHRSGQSGIWRNTSAL